MKNRKLILTFILLALTVVFLFVGVACSGEEGGGDSSGSASAGNSSGGGSGSAPDAPTGLSVDTLGKATWERVDDTTGYEVEVNGAAVTVRFTNYDLLTGETLPANGTFNIKVRSLNGDNKSSWSETVSYTYSGGEVVTPSISGLDGTTLKWTAPTFTEYVGIATPYPVVSVGGSVTELAATATEYSLASAATGEVSLYYKADGVYYKDSGKVKLVYDATDKSLSFAAPENVRMEGDLLVFDEVVGANIYYIQDVYNTVTSISGNDILALSSDRDGHFLVKAIWAGNTDLNIGDSASSPVTYFTEEQGQGTQGKPYLISSTSDLRFIEYYEALGEDKYYKLVSDIAFESYTPANDEDYSNFYNLGSFSGVLDGDGHTLKNIVVYYKDGYSSIFDTVYGTIKNIKIEDTAWRTWTNRTNDGIMHEKGGECAIFAYNNQGTIENVTLVSGSVTAVRDGAAGLVSINRGVIDNCVAEAGFTVYGANEAGAFAIYNVGTIKNCINYGTVGGKSTVGGIVGRNAGLVTCCGNEGNISAEAYGGGIVGYNYNVFDGIKMQFATKISYCYNKGTVECTSYAGGIVGRNGSDGVNEQAIVRYANAGVYGCYNQGTVTGMISVGGIAGENFGYYTGSQDEGFGIRACYSSGDINNLIKGLGSGKIYLAISACTWAEDSDPDIYVHYWSDTGTTTWPGVKMTKVTVGNASYYTADMPSYTPTGFIFSRVNPDTSVDLDLRMYNKTRDITATDMGDPMIFAINSDWTNASTPSAAALVGYNNMISDCYYVGGQTIGASDTVLRPIARQMSTAENTVYGKTRSELRLIANDLNTVLGEQAFVSVDGKYPVLKWQQTEGGQS